MLPWTIHKSSSYFGLPVRGKRRYPLLGFSAKKVTGTGESPVKGRHGDQGARALGIEAKFQFIQSCKDLAKGASYLCLQLSNGHYRGSRTTCFSELHGEEMRQKVQHEEG